MPDFIRTLETLFSFGFEPNERLEGFVDIFKGADELAFHVGYSPIQILAAAALEASAQSDLLGEPLTMSLQGMIANVAEYLVKNGARLTLDPPPTSRSVQRSSSAVTDSGSPGNEECDELNPVNRSHLRIQSNKQLEELLGKLRLNAAQMVWNSAKSVSSGKAIIHTDNKSVIEDSGAPGGSDEKSCAICWKSFGALVNRRHRCRITRRHVCDECSSKRLVQDGEEHRISDGQFLLARADLKIEESRKLEERKAEQKAVQRESHIDSARLERLEAEEQAYRSSLFGGVLEKVTKSVFGDVEQAEAPVDAIGGLSAKLGETRDALNERGEKLSTLAEKSDKLVNASKDFASLAKELNKKSQNQGLFW